MHDSKQPYVKTEISAKTEMAIIGMDAQLGNQQNIDRVERAFYVGSVLMQTKLEGSQSAVALCQASIERMANANQLSLSNIAVVIVYSDKAAASHTLEISAFEKKYASCELVRDLSLALPMASQQLAGQVDAVAIIGVNLCAESEATGTQQASICFDASFEGYQNFEGVASILLTSLDFASANAATTYSLVKSYASDTCIQSAADAALDKAQIQAEQINLLEVSALADKDLAEQERIGLLGAYAKTNQTLNTAISCTRSVTGEGDACSQVVGLLKCVMALHQRYIPAISDWQTPDENALNAWLNSPFYFPTEARPWFPNSDGSIHTAAYSCQTLQSNSHIILQEPQLLIEEQARVRSNGFIACSDLKLIILAGGCQQALLDELTHIEQLSETNSLADIALSCYEKAQELRSQDLGSQDLGYRSVLIAESIEELRKEIEQAKIGIKKACEEQGEWKTPKGSYFSAKAIEEQAKGGAENQVTDKNNVTFLYPGIGATYVGLGRDLFHLFPQIYQPVADLAEDIGESLKDRILSPRSVTRLSFKDLKQLDHDLRNSLANIAECGVGYACVFTKIFEEVFGVYADFAAGYSMGEVSMYAALGCWQQPGLMSERLAKSDTFNHCLSGELRTLREHWGLELDLDQTSTDKIWETYNVRATAEQVAEASIGEDRVYCTIINTPDSVLIGGFPADCERVIKKLGVRVMPMNMPNAIHSAPAHKEYPHMEALYTMDVTERIKTKMYSSSCYLPIPQRSKAIANSISKCLCDPVDFPRLVNSLHDKGAKVFIEMGAGRSLCGWVDKIIDEPHLSVPVNVKGTSDELTYFRALAKLICHGVTLNLESVFKGSIVVNKSNSDTL